MDETSPISYKTLAQQALDYLSNAIVTGQLQTGDRLVESELSSRLGISRAPIREALAALERQGLAFSVVRHGTFVRSWTGRDLWEVAILRANLEALAAELAATTLTGEDISYLRSLIDKMQVAEQASAVPTLIDLDTAFHARIIQRSGHQRLQQAMADLALQIRITRRVTRTTDHVDHPHQHQAFLQVLLQRDPLAARECAYEHIMSTARLALAAFRDGEPISLSPSS